MSALWRAVRLPSLGEGVLEAKLRAWCKNPGQWVEEEEPLLEISTDKLDAEIPAPESGYLVKVCKGAGEKIVEGELVGYLSSQNGQSLEFEELKNPAPPTLDHPGIVEKSPEPLGTPKKARPTHPSPQEEVLGQEPYFSPYVRWLAQQRGISLAELKTLPGRGLGGRFTGEDLEIWLHGRDGHQQKTSVETPLHNPSGFSQPLPALRLGIARGVAHSIATIPHASVSCEVELNTVLSLRSADVNSAPSLSVYFLYALAQVLKKHPLLRASLEGEEVVWKKEIHIGCAVALEAEESAGVAVGGVVVPVIRDVDQRDLKQLAAVLEDLVQRARAHSLSLAETQGGVFTFTNPGMFGSERSQAIIRWPEVAILSTGAMKMRLEPVLVHGDDYSSEEVIPVEAVGGWRKKYFADFTLTFDHRLLDGKEASLFLRDLKNFLQEKTSFSEGSTS